MMRSALKFRVKRHTQAVLYAALLALLYLLRRDGDCGGWAAYGIEFGFWYLLIRSIWASVGGMKGDGDG